MAESIQNGVAHTDVRYERTDVRVRSIVKVLVILGVLGAFFCGVVWVYFRSEERLLDRSRASQTPLAPTPMRRLPPPPRLEGIDRLEGGEAARSNQQKTARDRLSRFNKTKDDRFVQIPIDQAIRILATEKKLPSRPPRDLDTRDQGLIAGGEPNSGRLFVGRKP